MTTETTTGPDLAHELQAGSLADTIVLAATHRTKHDPSGNPRTFVVLYRVERTGDGTTYVVPFAHWRSAYIGQTQAACAALAKAFGAEEAWRYESCDAETHRLVSRRIGSLPEVFYDSVRDWRDAGQRHADRAEVIGARDRTAEEVTT